MTIDIITVGTRPKAETLALVDDFLKRLPKHLAVKWHYLKHSSGTPDTSKLREAESILRMIGPRSRVILLDETGKQLSSPALSQLLFEKPTDIVFVIGGAYGVHESVRQRAHFVWSLGKLVFPHQLVRVILAEQLYRAYSIHTGHPYHHA